MSRAENSVSRRKNAPYIFVYTREAMRRITGKWTEIDAKRRL